MGLKIKKEAWKLKNDLSARPPSKMELGLEVQKCRFSARRPSNMKPLKLKNEGFARPPSKITCWLH